MTESERLERGARAKRLLDDAMLTEGFEMVRKAIYERWEATPIRDRDGAHELRLMLKALADVRLALESVMNDGKIVQFNQQQSLMDRLRDKLGVNV